MSSTHSLRFAPLVTTALALALAGCPNRPGTCDIIRNPSCPIGVNEEIWLFAYSQSEVAEMAEHFGADRGLIAVKRLIHPTTNTVVLDIERGCHIDGGYVYTAAATQEQHVEVHSKDQLAATVPFTFGAFSAQFDQSNYMDVRYKSPGYYRATLPQARYADPACNGVTDFISYVRIGAYDTSFSTQTNAGAGVGGNVPGTNIVGASTSSGSDSKTSVGIFKDCDRATEEPTLLDAFLPGMGGGGAADPGAPPKLECTQPIQISLRPITEIPAAGGPNPTPGGSDACVDAFTVQNNAGFFFDKQTMTFTVDFNQMAQTGVVPTKQGAPVHAFTCTNDTWTAEADAMAKIVDWIKDHPAVRAHVSVRCNTQEAFTDSVFGGDVALSAGSHMQNISDVVAPLALSKQLVGSSSCDVGLMGGGKGQPGPSGIYIELVAGCPEGAAHSNNYVCK